jgi:hypothetical protein
MTGTTRQNIFKLKRSNVSGKIPTISQLLVGELAVNTQDGFLYTSIGDTGGTNTIEVRQVGWDRLSTLSGGTVNGNVLVTGSVSATTYYGDGQYLTGLVTNDFYVTGFTYNNQNKLTISQNGGQSDLNVYLNTFSGLTINGNLTVTGLTQTKGITSTGGVTFKQITVSSTYTATTEDYMIDVSGGTFTVYLPSAVGIQGRLLAVKNNGGGAVTVQPVTGQTIDDKPFVILGETNSIQLVSNGLNWVTLGYNISTVNSSTGVFEFSGLIIASTTTFNVAPVKGWVVDDTTNPLSPQLYYVDYSGGTHTATYVNTAVVSFVYLTINGTISQLDRPLTEQERRQNIFLGKLDHPNKTTIVNAFSQPDFVLSPLSQLRDMFVPINLINGGVRPSANGVNLSFNTSANFLYGLGINFANDTLQPNVISVSGTSPCSFQYVTQTGGTTSNVTLIDPTKYDVGGVITPLTGTKATNQRIYLLQNGQFRVQYGQVFYTTLAQAVAGIATEQFVEFSNNSTNAILIGILSVLSTTTDLSDTTKALFFNVSKFGDASGAAGGTPTTTLQQAYNNSTNPEIVTNSTLGGVQFRGGTGNDNDKNILIESNAGVQTAWITASGNSTFNSVYTNYVDFNTTASTTTQFGRINWDSGTGTLNIGIGDSTTGLVDFQVGQEEVVRVYNSEATTLQKGEIVYVSGSQGNRPSVKRASAVSDGYSVTTLGMVDVAIASGAEGYVTTFGIISNLNTLGLTGGTPIFLSPTTPGGYTSTKPIAPQHIVLIGYVVRVNATVGSIFINISNGWELDELHDVRISGVTTGDLLMRSTYNGSNVWVNTKNLLGNYTISGNTSNIGNFSVTGKVTTDSLQLNTSRTGSTSVAELTWNPNEGTLNIGMAGGNVTQQVGLENYIPVLNTTTVSGLTNGRVIRSAGVDPTTGKIVGAYMIADGTYPYYSTIGVATEDILSGNTGFVNTFGIVRDIDTTGTPYGETWLQGDILYVSPTILGGLTNVEPDSPNLKIQVAVVKNLGVSDGSILVRPSLGYTLSNLHNVKNTGSESNGDLLLYSGTSNTWVYGKELNGNYKINGNLEITSGILTATTINAGNITTNGIKYTNGPNSGYVLTSDATGNGYWDTLQPDQNFVYISTLGNDTTGTGLNNKPYQTLSKAISVFSGNTNVVYFLYPGLYTESTINIPDSITIIGASIGAQFQNGFNHVSTSGISNVNIFIENVNINNFDIDCSLTSNSIISLKNCYTGINRKDSVPSVLMTSSECTILNSTFSGGTNTINESLIIGTVTAKSGSSIIFENSKFVFNVEAEGNSVVRMLDCSLFGPSFYINGTIVGGNTPTWEVDATTNYLGGFSGNINKIQLFNNDTYVTGFTYNNSNTITLSQNNGVSGLTITIDIMSGLTINGTLSATTGNFDTINVNTLSVTGATITTSNINTLNATGATITSLTSNTISNVTYIDFDITQTGTTSIPGRLFWDVNNRTLSLGMIGGVTQQIGEEQYFLVENQTNGTLNDGTVVRAVGVNGPDGKIAIDYMIANGTIPAYTTIGVLTQPLNSGDTGYVTSFGLVRGVDTTGAPYGETWMVGDVLYVSPTYLGGFTKVKPIAPNQDIIVAIVMESSINGAIFVRPDVYRPFRDPKLYTVAKQNGDFTSIKAAVDSISGSSNSNRYLISVGPGEFIEGEIDLTNKPYISIVGSSIQTTLIKPLTNTQHIIKIGVNNEISFLSLSGAASNYAGIYAYDIGDFGQAHKVSFYDCDTNVWVESNTQDTRFYGEYLDFNGNYTYGTKVIGNNSYLALANMENYYNFPTGGNIVYSNYVTGSGATLSVFVSDSVGNGVSGSTAFFVQNGAELNASTITIDGFTYGIRNPNIGNPVRFDVDNASLVNCEWDLYVERNGTFGTFGGSSSHEKIFTVSSDVYWSFLDINDGELNITRKSSVTFADGTHTDFTTLIFEGSTMGLMEGGHISIVSGLTINVASGFGYLNKTLSPDVYVRLDWLSANTILTSGSSLYVYYNDNSVLSTSGSKPSSINNIILGRVVTDTTSVRFIDLSPVNAYHTSNRYDSLLSDAMGPIYASGSIVTEGTTPFTLNVSQGDYHYSSNEYLPTGGTGITFTQYYRGGLSDWITTATTIVTNTYYDGNGVLSALTTDYYTKHTLYIVGDGVNEQYMLVLGQNQYTSLVETENALLPTPPSFFSDSVTQIANIYVKQGTTGITQVEDIRPTIAFRAGGVNASSVHGNLLGLSADDHTQYLLVSGSRAMGGNLDMGGNQITNVGNVDGVDISSHATRHQFGGLDPVGSITPSANAIPYADVNGTLNSWVSTANTTTIGRVKLSATPNTEPIAVSVTDNGYKKAITGFTYGSNVLTGSSVDGTLTTTTIGLRTKSGSVAGASFAGSPKKATVTFTTAYPNTNYSILITGGVNRVFTYENKTTTGFTINANANTAFIVNVDWSTIAHGES